ncbi:MAG: adenylate/guanylate cyclase domain-containing protein [Candidatus Cloacimonetes bacterium HGW-Cloacimonetes-3]|jgi:adenylate cyclase|nr:MAG: adenylate/guanylate cyclase domain-containing protein [Candidatus Cloacimonetes bacterium HGW-Cloacimonetes-3]
MKRIKHLLYPLAILIIVKLLFLIPFFNSLEYKTQDSLFLFRGIQPLSDQIVLITIDDASFSALNESWPFPREYHAKLIENLNKAGVRQIVFDVEFTENSMEDSDIYLAETASMYNNVIFAGKVLPAKEDGYPSQMLTPITEITDRELSWGVVNMNPDTDGFIRKYTCFEPFDSAPVYSIGVASLANYRVYQPSWESHLRLGHSTLSVADKTIPLISQNKALINYHGPAGTFKQISYASVLDDSTMSMPGYQGMEMDEFYEILASGELKDKIVLIGATVDELHDKFPTPFGGEWTPGVEIHANFIDMVLTGKYLSYIHPYFYLLIELLLLVVLWFAFRKLKPQLSAMAVLLMIAIQYAVAYLVFSKSGLILPIVQTALALLAVYVASILNHYLETMKEKRFIRSAFQQYMAPELVNQLLLDPKKLKYGGSLQELTVLFSDIRSFTTYSESHTPEETVNILHEYLTEMVSIIIKNQGILDKFVGDEVMALFGTPIPLPNHALNACKVALEMRARLTEMQEQWLSEGRQPFEIGIGVNTGFAVVGNLGSEQIFDFTAIGDTINLGARLEAINKEYNTEKKIIISEFTLEHVKDLVEVNYLDSVTVKGKTKPVKIYELKGLIA